MEIVFALLAGYVIGLLQKGIHIYKDQKPVAPKKEEKPVYNEDFSHELPPEMQKYFVENQGYIK